MIEFNRYLYVRFIVKERGGKAYRVRRLTRGSAAIQKASLNFVDIDVSVACLHVRSHARPAPTSDKIVPYAPFAFAARREREKRVHLFGTATPLEARPPYFVRPYWINDTAENTGASCRPVAVRVESPAGLCPWTHWPCRVCTGCKHEYRSLNCLAKLSRIVRLTFPLTLRKEH